MLHSSFIAPTFLTLFSLLGKFIMSIIDHFATLIASSCVSFTLQVSRVSSRIISNLNNTFLCVSYAIDESLVVYKWLFGQLKLHVLVVRRCKKLRQKTISNFVSSFFAWFSSKKQSGKSRILILMKFLFVSNEMIFHPNQTPISTLIQCPFIRVRATLDSGSRTTR